MRSPLLLSGTAVALVVVACSGTTITQNNIVSSGGSTSSGGAPVVGGSNAIGGATNTGFSTATGGSTVVGGSPSTGGSSSPLASSGGTSGNAGATQTGGAMATGGSSSTGANSNSGGIVSTGGAITTGGMTASGGLANTGGALEAGGTSATGGIAATGGAVATGGTSTGGAATGGAVATGGAATGGAATGGAATGGAATGGAATGGAAATGGTTAQPYVLPTAATDIYLGANGLVLNGSKAYITRPSDTSLKVLDVSNPLSPTVIGSVNHGFSDSQTAVHAVYNNIAWVARSSCCGYGYATSIFGVDVSNPASPTIRGSLQLQTASSLISWWSNSLVYSGYLLVQDYAQNKVYVIDISNPDAPTKFGEWSVPWMVDGGDAGMTVDGHYLYMPCRQAFVLNIYDLTNLAAVTLVGSVSTGTEEALEWPAKIGSYLYMNVSTYSSGVVHMKIIDVSNPAAPTIVGTVPSTGETIAKNGRLFTLGTSGSNATITAYSLANPILPVVEASSTVPPPAPSTSLNLWLMASPQTGWVGNYLVGLTDGSTGYSGVRALYFPVN